jgi:hypothetical protein
LAALLSDATTRAQAQAAGMDQGAFVRQMQRARARLAEALAPFKNKSTARTSRGGRSAL